MIKYFIIGGIVGMIIRNALIEMRYANRKSLKEIEGILDMRGGDNE